jgi:hypothetical protein
MSVLNVNNDKFCLYYFYSVKLLFFIKHINNRFSFEYYDLVSIFFK